MGAHLVLIIKDVAAQSGMIGENMIQCLAHRFPGDKAGGRVRLARQISGELDGRHREGTGFTTESESNASENSGEFVRPGSRGVFTRKFVFFTGVGTWANLPGFEGPCFEADDLRGDAGHQPLQFVVFDGGIDREMAVGYPVAVGGGLAAEPDEIDAEDT